MPDKIKDAYEAFKDTQIFIDENDFREQVKKDPKGVFDLFNEEESTKGVFVDYNDFESQLGLKKKETFGFGFATASEASASTKPQVKVPLKSTSETKTGLQPFNEAQIKKANTKSTANINKPQQQVVPKLDIKADEGSIADLSIKKQKYTDGLNVTNNEYLLLERQYSPLIQELETLGKEYESTQDPKIAERYNALYTEAKPALEKMKNLSENEKILSAGLRSVEQMQDSIYENNYGFGSMVKRGIGNTVANLVNSTGKIIETFGDLAAENSFATAYTPDAIKVEDNKLTDQLASDIDEYYKRINESVNRKVPKSFANYSPLSDKPSAAKLLDFGINAFAQLAPTVAAGITTGGLGAAAMGFTMEFGNVYDTFHDPIKQRYINQGLNEKEAEAKADLEAGLISTGVATIIGQLDKFGATEMISAASKKLLAKKITQDALIELGEKTGKEAAEAAVKKSLVKNLAEFAKGYGKAVLPETVTEPIQELVAPATADVYEAVTGDEVFEEGLGNKQTWINAGNAAVGAFMASSPMGVISGSAGVTPQGYRKAVSMKDPAEFDKFNAILTAEVESGLTTPEQAQEAINVIQKVQAVDEQIPSTIVSEEERTAAANLLIEKQAITEDIEGKDEALVSPQKERLKQIDQQLTDVATGKFTEQLSEKIQNEQEQETEEAPSSETVADTIVSDGSATPTTVESTEVAPEVVSETASEIEPPVVEQTTTDVGGVTAPDVSEEAKSIKLKYNNKGEHLAPNGRPSNLPEIDSKIVRTNDFKKWFGDWENDKENSSKVLDENGEPLIVYHGSDNDFSEFDKNKTSKGFFFSPNKNTARIYGKNVKSYFVNIKNPLNKGASVQGAYDKTDIENTNYDGLIVYAGGSQEIIATEPNQIKQINKQEKAKELTTQFEDTKKDSSIILSESARKSENLEVSEREKEIQLLDTKKKIAQLEKELRKAPLRPSKGKASQKQLRTQIRNYRDQLRELEGKPPRLKPKGSVLTRAIGRFQSEVNEGSLSNEERLVLDLIGRVSESDKDVMGIDQKQVANQKKKGVIVKDGLTIDQIVTDFISENELSEDMAQDLRDYAIDFLSKRDAYEFMKEVKERESTPDPDALRDDEYYGYGYQLAEDLDMTVEEQDLLESEVAEILLSGKQLTDKQYAELQAQFAEEIESIRSGQETIDKSDDTKKGKGDKIQEDVEIFEQVLTINDTTKLKSSKKAKIKEVIESKSDNDIISYIAENIDDIKAQLRDKVGLTTECKW